MLHIRLMTAVDVPWAMCLKEQNGWNQLEADWHRLLAFEPDGCFVAERDGIPVGTTCTCVFDSVAWIAMVLVDAGHRNCGIGRALVQHALDYIDQRHVRSIRLDATPLGRPVYEKLGFVAEYRLARYEGTLAAAEVMEDLDALDSYRPELREHLIQWDSFHTGTNRTKLLCRLLEESPEAVRVVHRQGQFHGYLAARPGTRAVQIGPCLATPLAGPRLLMDAARRLAGRPVLIDIPTANIPARSMAETLGLGVQRHLLRMGRGEAVRENIDYLWASSGPEKG